MEIKSRTKFDFIRYANCWEDSDILLESGKGYIKNGISLSICSGGDNTLSLLSQSPDTVVAFDISLPQLSILHLKKEGIKQLEYEEFLQFIGVKNVEWQTRIDIYEKVRPLLPDFAVSFWDDNRDKIKSGIISHGKFENYFKLFRKYLIIPFWGKKNIKRLLLKKSRKEREQFFEKKINFFLFRVVFKLFFSRKTMGALGRDKEFFKYVDDHIAMSIFERMKYALTVLPTDNNPYLEFIMTGNFLQTLPTYLRPENYKEIKQNIDKLEIRNGTLEEVLDSTNESFDFFNLSDIFEYISIDEYKSQLELIAAHSKKNARVSYWNMQVPRYSTMVESSKFIFDKELSRKLHSRDKAFFYQAFIVENCNVT